jgi:hypothetical protein
MQRRNVQTGTTKVIYELLLGYNKTNSRGIRSVQGRVGHNMLSQTSAKLKDTEDMPKSSTTILASHLLSGCEHWMDYPRMLAQALEICFVSAT